MKDPGSDINTKPAATDSGFMKTLAQGGVAEVKAGKMATEKASDPAVKQLAQQMVQDHTNNNDELKALAKASGVTLPATTGRQLQAQESKLQRESGASFDSAYIKDQVRDHQKTVQLLGHEIHTGQDAAVRQFAPDTLTVVSAMAKELESKLPKPVAADSSK